ncbi:hypothetical protein QYE76_058977 [Lolium multiflorum]|uniref:Uncharacterized protein n=1 Tax=Lolium multiflorum TaxID=4521 RepID=A0AAD8T840_LOLMU|nr:hypothetical protein QYE76_058977 [Lolium multiflorum]
MSDTTDENVRAEFRAIQRTICTILWRDVCDLDPDERSSSRRAEQSPESGSEMAKFDPWPVFFKREWGRNWPFLAGFAVTGFLITKLTAGFTEEDLKNSKFVQEHKR